VFGHYGRERWDGRSRHVVAPPAPPTIEAARQGLPELVASLGLPGVRIEDKGSALAVHTRQSPDPAAALAAVRVPVTGFAAAHDLAVEPGRYVIELRPPGMDKGTTLGAHVAAVRARAVMYTGDDLGDLSAFATVDALRSDGVAGLKVCSGSAEAVEVAGQADLVVDGPDGVMDLLDQLIDEIEAH
jgi:trehalose 6-phosphate phosphatase